MSRGHSSTLAERSAVGTAGEVGADSELVALQDRPRPVLPRHCWVTGLPESPGRLAGLLAEWRQDRAGGGWQGRVVYAVDDGAATVLVEAWYPPATCSRPVSRPRPSDVCDELPCGCGGGGEFVDAGSALTELLGVLLCPLGVALALLTAATPAASV